MKKELKFFLLGVLSTIVAAGIIFGVIFLISFIKEKTRKHNNTSNHQQSEVIDGYRYTENTGYYDDDTEQIIVCSVLNNIKQYSNGLFVTNSNELYELNTTQKFSDTNENCHKITDIKIKKIIGSYYLSEDNKLYHNEWMGEGKREIRESASDGYTNRIFLEILSNDDILSAKEIKNECKDDKCVYIYEVLKTDGKVYEYTITTTYKYNSWSDKSEYTAKLDKEEIKYEFPNEKIIEYGTTSWDGRRYAITDKGVYMPQLKNPECNNYADVECEYGLAKEDYFSKKINDIAIISEIEGEGDWGRLNYYNKEGKYIQLHKAKDGEA